MLERLKDSLKAWEGGFVPHLYLDTKGYVTTGCGHRVPSPEDACALPWKRLDGSVASPAEVMQEYHRVLSMQRGMLASYYALNTKLRLPKEATVTLLDTDIAEKQAEVAASIPGFSALPEPVRVALLDMAFNLGVAGLLTFTHLIASVKIADWANCAAECHRLDIAEERNAWTSRLFLEAGVPRT